LNPIATKRLEKKKKEKPDKILKKRKKREGGKQGSAMGRSLKTSKGKRRLGTRCKKVTNVEKESRHKKKLLRGPSPRNLASSGS